MSSKQLIKLVNDPFNICVTFDASHPGSLYEYSSLGITCLSACQKIIIGGL